MSEIASTHPLTVVITLASDSTEGRYDPSYLTRCLDSLHTQENAPSMSIIVPYPAQAREFENLQEIFHDVMFLPVDDPIANTRPGQNHKHFDVLRANGLAHARGEIIAMVEDQELVDQNWAINMIQAHSMDYAVIGGSIENGVDRPLNWAVYFCDFLEYQNPLASGETLSASDVNISYKREVLEAVRSTWQDGYHEPFVHREIISRGWKIASEPKAIVYQVRTGLKLGRVLKERVIWGRHYAAHRQIDFPRWKSLVYSVFSFFLPVMLLLRKTNQIFKKRRNTSVFFKVLPLTVLLTVFWSGGEMLGYITGRS